MTKEKDDFSRAEKRLHARRSVLWSALLLVGEHQFRCQVWNLSLGGARIRLELPLQTGAEVFLQFPERGRVAGVVNWYEDGAMGLAFTESEETVRNMFSDKLHILGLDPNMA